MGESQLVRGLAVLELLVRRPMSAADLGRAIGVNRSTALRLTGELETAGYVERDPESKLYRLTSRGTAHQVVPSGASYEDWMGVLEPLLERVNAASGEATTLALPAAGAMVYVAFLPSRHRVAVQESLGSLRPKYCSAVGKAYIAALDDSAREVAIDSLSLEGGTARAAHEPVALRRRIEHARRDGYAIDDEETFTGVRCVAVPTRVHGVLIGALGISGPVTRLSLKDARAAGRAILAELGPYAAISV